MVHKNQDDFNLYLTSSRHPQRGRGSPRLLRPTVPPCYNFHVSFLLQDHALSSTPPQWNTFDLSSSSSSSAWTHSIFLSWKSLLLTPSPLAAASSLTTWLHCCFHLSPPVIPFTAGRWLPPARLLYICSFKVPRDPRLPNPKDFSGLFCFISLQYVIHFLLYLPDTVLGHPCWLLGLLFRTWVPSRGLFLFSFSVASPSVMYLLGFSSEF